MEQIDEGQAAGGLGLGWARPPGACLPDSAAHTTRLQPLPDLAACV